MNDLENLSKEQWQDIASKVIDNIETRLFIDGDYVDAENNGQFETINPDTGEVLAMVSLGTADDIDRAVVSGRRLSLQGPGLKWRRGIEWRSCIDGLNWSAIIPESSAY